MSDQAKCGLCGEPMPPGEEMFNYHGYSCPCPKPPMGNIVKCVGTDFTKIAMAVQAAVRPKDAEIARLWADNDRLRAWLRYMHLEDSVSSSALYALRGDPAPETGAR